VKEILSLSVVCIIILYCCIKSDPKQPGLYKMQNLFAHIVVLTINKFWSCVTEIVKAIESFYMDFPWWNSNSFRFMLVFLLFVAYYGIRETCVCKYLYYIIPLLWRYQEKILWKIRVYFSIPSSSLMWYCDCTFIDHSLAPSQLLTRMSTRVMVAGELDWQTCPIIHPGWSYVI
jgi:hypothetical protein